MPSSKIKFALRMTPETQQLVKTHYPRDNCASQNEFIEKAIRFYAGFLSTADASEFLNESMLACIKGAIEVTENRIARMLFKMSVEQNIMSNILAAFEGVDAEQIARLRGRCVEEVRRTNGGIRFEDNVKFQKGM